MRSNARNDRWKPPHQAADVIQRDFVRGLAAAILTMTQSRNGMSPPALRTRWQPARHFSFVIPYRACVRKRVETKPELKTKRLVSPLAATSIDIGSSKMYEPALLYDRISEERQGGKSLEAAVETVARELEVDATQLWRDMGAYFLRTLEQDYHHRSQRRVVVGPDHSGNSTQHAFVQSAATPWFARID